jgi:RNA polymerase sigma factor (sigma-70 family)
MARCDDNSLTSVSLIQRVGRFPTDQAAWSEFVDRYGPKVRSWSQNWGLQAADAEDVTQTVLIKLSRRMAGFSYDPSGSFRGWLRRLARNAWQDWLTQRTASRRAGGGADSDALLGSVAARDDLVRRLEETFDLEILGEAVHRVRERVVEKTWEAYKLTAQDGLAAVDVAGRLGMSVAGVYKAKSNVLKMIQEEVQALDVSPDAVDDL